MLIRNASNIPYYKAKSCLTHHLWSCFTSHSPAMSDHTGTPCHFTPVVLPTKEIQGVDDAQDCPSNVNEMT